ncbi:hypothetical protein ASD32_24695 [Rhizobium sp. Root483D2]|nr:hypothetical protein ASD32_24695 [Rhizobium sp. Root483D2]
MADRFRELERPQTGRLKDVVLMATVTGFEGLRHPRRTDLKQFSELFDPLFSASSDEARRQAAAALSQCPHVPPSVALQIGNAPISIAAIFLTRSTSIDDTTLLKVIRAQGQAHATAIARRDNLSVHVVDALVERRQTATAPAMTVTPPAVTSNAPAATVAAPAMTAAPTPSRLANAASAERAPVAPSATARSGDVPLERPPQARADDMTTAKLLREEKLRGDLKSLARIPQKAAPALPVIEPLDVLHEALLVRFARSGEANLFAASLAAALRSSPDLGERIVLDISGQQLATTLIALDMHADDSLFVLCAFYPDLSERLGGATRGEALLASLTAETCRIRVQAWLQSDQKDGTAAGHQAYLSPDRANDPRQTASRPDASRTAADPQSKRSLPGR